MLGTAAGDTGRAQNPWRERETETERDRDREREAERGRERETETERQKETERQTETETEIERESTCNKHEHRVLTALQDSRELFDALHSKGPHIWVLEGVVEQFQGILRP